MWIQCSYLNTSNPFYPLFFHVRVVLLSHITALSLPSNPIMFCFVMSSNFLYHHFCFSYFLSFYSPVTLINFWPVDHAWVHDLHTHTDCPINMFFLLSPPNSPSHGFLLRLTPHQEHSWLLDILLLTLKHYEHYKHLSLGFVLLF